MLGNDERARFSELMLHSAISTAASYNLLLGRRYMRTDKISWGYGMGEGPYGSREVRRALLKSAIAQSPSPMCMSRVLLVQTMDSALPF